MKCEVCGKEILKWDKKSQTCSIRCNSIRISDQLYLTTLTTNPELYESVKSFLIERQFPNAVGSMFIRFEMSHGLGIENNPHFKQKIAWIMTLLGYESPRNKGCPFRRIE
jgi:hypothetical protein